MMVCIGLRILRIVWGAVWGSYQLLRDGALLEDVYHWGQGLRAYSTTPFPILLSVSGVDENVIS